MRAEYGPGLRVESAGLRALDGYAPHPEAIRLMAERGLDVTAYRSRQLTPALALAADLILVMDREQKAWCEALVPSVKGRVFLLGCWLPEGRQEIADPFCKPPEAFTMAFERIHEAVVAWRQHLHLDRRT